MADSLLIDRAPLASGCVETWTLNDPASRNALSEAMVDGLIAACERAATDADLRGVVLRGAGGHFCAGGSLGGFAKTIGQPLAAGDADPLVPLNRRFGALLQALCAQPQWLIVAVEGAAMGGGFGLVCCGDHVLAHTSAQFATPEVTLGIVPAQIAPFVVQRLGTAAARRCLLTGERWDAAAAQHFGLVDDVVDGDMDAAVQAAIARHAAAAPQAVAATKRLLLAQTDRPLPALLDDAAIAFAQALRGPEAPLGLAAFAARKAPPWNAI
ncbi:enoyl-CoA hydratase/isomerase family protein [Acidovorax sp. JMULE5]|uniref:enoyl-CoA hydratase/isomerase family protein n=1 Tax=Acidovorax sp. JMULE5 TaxID=2518343 RepID=UPI00159FDC1D|nr:enoyl-CoA hydratase/isomerase family protein [Acidovorax sp. JMULE5]QLA82842.1 enoyl-CoA hydratase/isomerase family protein [Acidovorax sp. JMULE5]